MTALPTTLAAILEDLRLSGASDAGLLVLSTTYADLNHRKRSHLASAIRNGLTLDGRTVERIAAYDPDGDPNDFYFESPHSGGIYLVHVSVYQPPATYAEPRPAKIVVASCSDHCPSTAYVGWCRHREFVCRRLEEKIRRIDAAEAACAAAGMIALPAPRGNTFAVSAPREAQPVSAVTRRDDWAP